MAEITVHEVDSISIYEKNSEFFVSSMQVAEHFEKHHKHVLRDIRKLIADLPKNWVRSNFGPTVNLRENPAANIESDLESPAYLLTQDAFTLLAMGFTGKKALVWKLKYIAAFNAMREGLNRLRELASQPRQPVLDEKTAFQMHVLQIAQAERINYLYPPDDRQTHDHLLLLVIKAMIGYFAFIEGITFEQADALCQKKLGFSHATVKSGASAVPYDFVSAVRGINALVFRYWHDRELREYTPTRDDLADLVNELYSITDTIARRPISLRLELREHYGVDFDKLDNAPIKYMEKLIHALYMILISSFTRMEAINDIQNHIRNLNHNLLNGMNGMHFITD